MKGKTLHKNKNYIIIDVNCVGYKVFVTNNLFSQVNLNDEIEVFIYTNVKEDDITLYGFNKSNELNLFEKLISISGIGPKMALDILDSPLYIIQNAIINNNPSLLTEIKGIGKKTAERIILELKNKIDPNDFDSRTQTIKEKSINEDIITALTGLGYEKYQIIKKFQDLPEDIEITEEKIKWFLQNQ